MTEQFIGNYKVIKKIGAGGMARVYLAVHKDVPNLKVVLKILSDPRLADRFRQEADKLALLDGHANVCRIKHFFNHGDEFAIAMEHIDGTTLEEMIKKTGRVPVNDAVQIISEVLSTLEFAHQKDIFHRDIKPGNIMVDTRGQVKIIDFGIAKSKTDPNLTVAGTSCGTPAYMPPEQFNPTDQIDYALVDVYAVGTTLFHMLTGELPFKAENQFALRDAKLFNDPPSPRNLNPDIPKELEDIILKSMARSPDDRFASSAEMRVAVDALRKDSAPVDLTRITAPPAPTPSISGKKPSSRKIAPLAALAAVVVIAAVYWFFIRTPGPQPVPVPRLLTPEANAILDSGLPVFTWTADGATDAAYILEYAADSLFAESIEKTMLSTATYTPAVALADGRYFWRVQAVDRGGNRGAPSSPFSFTVSAPVAAASAILEVTVDPRGDIFIDGEPYGSNKSRLTVTLDTGQHVVKTVNQRSEQRELSRNVYLADGARETASFRFTFPPVTARVDSGEVRIGSFPEDGAIVFIDGQLQDLRTNNTWKLPVGKHIIKVVLTLDGEELEQIDSVLIEKDGSALKKFNFEK